MIYTVYRFINDSNEIVFQFIIEKDDINSVICYDNKWWEVKHIITYFLENNLSITTYDFTIDELMEYILSRRVNEN